MRADPDLGGPKKEGSGADPDLASGRAGGPLHLCGCGGSWGGRGVPLAAALRRTADGGPGGRNLGGGSGGGLVLGRAGGPVRLRVCAARGEGVVGHKQYREGARWMVCARGGMCAWVLGGRGGGRGRAWTYSAAVLPEGSEFGPEAHSTDGTVGIRGEC